MASIIVYLLDTKYIDNTISEIFDKTPPHLIDEVIVCDDTGSDYTNDLVRVIHTDHAGKPSCWNAAAKEARSSELVFLNDTTKLSQNWLQPLIARVADSKKLVSPVIHTLNTEFWATENSSWQRWGWRWDLSLYSRPAMGTSDSPSISSSCIVVTSNWFERLGGFDEMMKRGSGYDLEISLRSWLLGGGVEVEDDSYIAVRQDTSNDAYTIRNLARIAEIWIPKYSGRFFSARNLESSRIDTGRLSNLLDFQARSIHSIEWFLQKHQPELGSLFDLKNTASNKSIAVVGTGSSIDDIDPALIYRNDIIISIDYMGIVIGSDYVVTNSSHVAIELRTHYKDKNFVLPMKLRDRATAQYVPAANVVEDCYQFESSSLRGTVVSELPPFCNFDNPLHHALNFALFLGPKSISLFGCDNKIVDGKSHSSKIDYYDGGVVLSDSEATRKEFEYSNYGVSQLGKLATSLGIPLIRIGHA